MAKLRDVAFLCLASASALPAQHRFPLRYVGPVEARSAISIGTMFPVIGSLPDGRLMVTDTAGKRSFILDAALSVATATPYSVESRTTSVYLGTTLTDSAPLMRWNAATRAIDTVTRVRVTRSTMRLDTLTTGALRWRATFEVLPTIDEWTTLLDGTIAVVRGADYHIDWYRTDGTHGATPAMQIDWRRMTDSEKVGRVEALRAAYEAGSLARKTAATSDEGATEQTGGTDGPRSAVPAARAASEEVLIEFAPPSTLPDFLPPVFVGGVKSDPEGNVWIAPTSSSYAGWAGFMYDRVNRRGEIIDRVRFPKDRVLVGFGDNGTIYMIAIEADGMFLERASLLGPGLGGPGIQ